MTELIAGKPLAELLGMERETLLLRGYGLREIGVGAGILTEETPSSGWFWARFGGDLLDLTTLALAVNPRNPKRANVVAALAAVGGITVLDYLCAQQLQEAA